MNVPGETIIRAVARADWTVASQRAIGALLQPLGDDELDIIASGLAALQRAFQRAQEQGTAGHAGSPPPC